MPSFLQSDRHFAAIAKSIVKHDPFGPKKAEVERILQDLQHLNALTVAIKYEEPCPVYSTVDFTEGILLTEGGLFKALQGLRFQIEEHQIGRTLPATDRFFGWTGRKLTRRERTAIKQLDKWYQKFAVRVAMAATEDLDTWAIR